ncbi:hypothetical protein HanPI659440_Chr10g0372771 [Helianthus annuus]|nr:hypothetical protein HanPI659440_Chr10g0372771 [Helianthus annuus]
MHHAQPCAFVPLVLARGLPCHARRTRTLLGPCSPCDQPRGRGQKYKGSSQAARGDAKCKVRHQSATLRLIAHATRARVRACASASDRSVALQSNIIFISPNYP